MHMYIGAESAAKVNTTLPFPKMSSRNCKGSWSKNSVSDPFCFLLGEVYKFAPIQPEQRQRENGYFFFMACTKGAGSRSHHVYPGQGSRRKTIPVKSFTATEECGTSTSSAEPCKANCFGICSLGGLSLHGCCLKGSQLPLRFIRMLSGELEMLLGGCSGCGVREGGLRFPAAALPSPVTAGDPSCPAGVRDGSRRWQC